MYTTQHPRGFPVTVIALQATSVAQPGATWSATATEELGKPCESFSHQRVTAGAALLLVEPKALIGWWN